MNQSFSLKRFWLLLKYDYAENKSNYLIASGLIIGLMFLFMAPILMSDQFRMILLILHLIALSVCLMLGGSLFTSTAFAAYSTALKGIPALLLPASRQEKFWAALLVNLFFMLTFLSLFFAMHFWFIDMANSRLLLTNHQYQPMPAAIAQLAIYIYFLLQGAAFLGSIYFTKAAYIKSVAVLIVVAIAIYLIHTFLAEIFTPNQELSPSLPFGEWGFPREGRWYQVSLPPTVESLKWLFLIVVIMVIWYISFVRLKEKEI